MAFFNSAVTVLQTLVIALGAGLGIWGAINLLEGYGNDNPGAKSQGMKQLMAGGGVALIGTTLVPTIQVPMLMCDKVTHKKLIDSNLLFRKISRNLLSKMIQYNSKKIF
jgi:hypothetical protein